MQLSDQVCSLELAKRLKELGVVTDSFFHWYISHRSGYSFILESEETNYCVDSNDNYDVYSAFNVAELFSLVPIINGISPEIIKGMNFGDLTFKYCARYYCENIIPESSENIANAVANLIIFLLENGLMEVPR